MEKIISKLKKSDKKYLIIGDAMLDIYVYGSVQRISPEAPVPVFSYGSRQNILGGAANVASNIAAMGKTAGLLAVTGNDAAAAVVKSLLEERNVRTDLLYEDCSRVTTQKIRLVSAGQQMVRIDEEETTEISPKTEETLIQLLEEYIDEYDIVLLSDYQKGLLTRTFTQQVIHTAKEHNKKVLVDVKAKDASKYSGAYLLKPNRKELQYMTEMSVNTKDEVIAAVKQLKKSAACSAVIATLSGDGMVYLDAQDNIYESNVEAKQVCDVVGAGDTAFAYIGLGIAENLRPQTLLRLANAASSIKVTKFGTSVVTLDELSDSFGRKPSKVQDLEGLLKLLHKFRERKPDAKIVFTNGCFDILHLGHARYLKEAKTLGDILIVAVNSDASVRRLKGESRPINHEEVRMAMLAELDFIDYVLLFEEDTPYRLIQAIQPDVLVKGGDYKPEDIVGHDIVEAKGGLVTTIDLVDGMSTTNIIEAIQNESDK